MSTEHCKQCGTEIETDYKIPLPSLSNIFCTIECNDKYIHEEDIRREQKDHGPEEEDKF